MGEWDLMAALGFVVTQRLFEACDGDSPYLYTTKFIKELLRDGADLNARRSLRVLCLSYHIRVNTSLTEDITPVFLACFRGNSFLAELLLECGAKEERALFAAAEGDWFPGKGSKPKLVRLLLDRGFDANFKTATGRTVLCAAAESRCIETVRLLMERGAVVGDCVCSPLVALCREKEEDYEDEDDEESEDTDIDEEEEESEDEDEGDSEDENDEEDSEGEDEDVDNEESEDTDDDEEEEDSEDEDEEEESEEDEEGEDADDEKEEEKGEDKEKDSDVGNSASSANIVDPRCSAADMVRLLLESGADFNVRGEDGSTLVDMAIAAGKQELADVIRAYHT